MTAKNKIIPFGKPGTTANEPIDEEGDIGKLKYKVFKRGVVHIIDETKGLIFKKDPDMFEDEVKKLNLNTLTEGDIATIKASGDNDDLVFECKNGDIEIRLERKAYSMVDRLKKILASAKKKKNG